ncbi:MAG: pseudouridine synthase [Eubacteriales bacterium]
MEIVHLSREFVVVNKPRGMLSEGECPEKIAEMLRERGEANADEVYTVHRLDRTTAGLMVYARTKRAAAELSACIAGGDFHKTYAAFVTADPALPPSGELRDMLFFDRRRDKAYVVDGNRRGAKEAVLTYDTAGVFALDGVTVTKLRVCPRTGRSHQIRIQFASRRSPLIGDSKYGSRVRYHGPALISCELQWKNFQFSLPFDQIVPLPRD